MSYGPALTGANPNQRTWKLQFAKKLTASDQQFSYANFTFDFPDLTTLNEPHVQRALFTIERVSANNVNHSNDCLLMCTAADAGFNIGHYCKDSSLIQNNQGVANLNVTSNTIADTASSTFVAKWPIETIAFQLVDPYELTVISSSLANCTLDVSLKVEIIEPLANVTNEIVQTADYSGIKRARIAPQPPV